MKKYLKVLSIILAISIVAVSLVSCSSGNRIGLVIDNKSETVTNKDQTISGSFSSDADVVSVSYSVQHNNDNGFSDSGEAIIKDNTYSFTTRLLLDKNKITVTAITKDGKKQNKKITITYDSGQTYEELEKDNISIDEKTKMQYVNNIIRIYFSNDVSDEKINDIVSSINGEIVGAAYGIGERDIKIPETDLNTLEEICNNLTNIKEVVYATYDIIMPEPKPTASINDPYKNANGGDWYLDAIEAYSAWDYNNRFNEINIGICDDGFDTGHEDLKNVINFPTQWLNELNSKENHGTHVAGIIGAIANNKKGIAGLDWKSKLYCIDWQPTEKQKKDNIAWNTESRILSSLRYAVESGCKVVNYSLGYTSSMPNGTTEFDSEFINRTGSISALYMYQLLNNGYDFIVVQSSGNGTSGKNNPADEKEDKNTNNVLAVDAINNGLFCSVTEDSIILPENSTITKQDILDRIIIVGNAQKNDDGNYQQHVTSNGGKQVDICAPGTNIYSTVPGVWYDGWINGTYANYDGTSMSAPMVTAVCGIVWSVNDKFTGKEVKDIVCNSYNKDIWVWDNPDGKHTTNDKYRMLNAKLSVEEAIKRTDTENIKEDNKQADSVDYKKLYTDYVNDNIISQIGVYKDFEKTLSNIPENEIYKSIENDKGLSSVYIEDFNNDKIPEMFTVSVLGKDTGFIKIQVHLYCIENNKVIDKNIVYETEKYDNADEQLYVYTVNNNDNKYLCLSDQFWYGASTGSIYAQYFKAFSVDNKNNSSAKADLTFSYNRGNVIYKINGSEYVIAQDGIPTDNSTSVEGKLSEIFTTIGLNEFTGVNIEGSNWMNFPQKATATKIFECGTKYASDYEYKAYLKDYTDFSNKHNEVDTTVKENTTKLVETTSAKKETTTKEKTTESNLENELLNYYWKNSIQSPHIYEFKDNNTVIEYDALPNEPKSSWSYYRQGTYSMKNNKLIMKFFDDYGEYSYELQYLTLKKNIDWDTGLHLEEQLKDNEYFFYEVGFEAVTNGPAGNAFYLQKGIKK